MKIALIGHKQIPGRSGGVEVVVEELATRLVNRGQTVVAYNRKRKGQPSPSSYKGVRIIDIPCPNTKKLNAVIYSYLATIRAIISNPDIIHYHALGPSASLWLAKLFKKKVVVTVHGLNYKTPKWKGFGAKYIMFGERIAAKHSDEVIVLSEAIKRYFKEKYNRDVRYIPNGISMPDFIEDDSILDDLDLRNNNYILCVTRLVPGKGLEILLNAYRNVPGKTLLIIAGDADYMDDYKVMLKELAEGDNRIRFIGFVQKRDLCALYSNADLFVLPSEAEGMPMSLLEAMWFNCPCLVSDIDENVEVLCGYGMTFHMDDANDLKAKLANLVDNPPARINTRDVVSKQFDWEAVVDSTIALYERVSQ